MEDKFVFGVWEKDPGGDWVKVCGDAKEIPDLFDELDYLFGVHPNDEEYEEEEEENELDRVKDDNALLYHEIDNVHLAINEYNTRKYLRDKLQRLKEELKKLQEED